MTKIMPMFSSKNSVILVLTFRSKFHFKLIFIYGMRYRFNFILLHDGIQLSQHHGQRDYFLLKCIWLISVPILCSNSHHRLERPQCLNYVCFKICVKTWKGQFSLIKHFYHFQPFLIPHTHTQNILFHSQQIIILD